MTDLADIKLIFETDSCDIAIEQGDIATDSGLETAVFISLFTDARLPDSMAGPLQFGADRRGFWGDTVDPDDTVPTGSLLWTLENKTITTATLADAKKYCSDALQWMVSDGIAQSINIVVERISREAVGIYIEILRPADSETYRYFYNWNVIGGVAC